MVLTCVPLMSSGVEHLFVCLWAPICLWNGVPSLLFCPQSWEDLASGLPKREMLLLSRALQQVLDFLGSRKSGILWEVWRFLSVGSK